MSPAHLTYTSPTDHDVEFSVRFVDPTNLIGVINGEVVYPLLELLKVTLLLVAADRQLSRLTVVK